MSGKRNGRSRTRLPEPGTYEFVPPMQPISGQAVGDLNYIPPPARVHPVPTTVPYARNATSSSTHSLPAPTPPSNAGRDGGGVVRHPAGWASSQSLESPSATVVTKPKRRGPAKTQGDTASGNTSNRASTVGAQTPSIMTETSVSGGSALFPPPPQPDHAISDIQLTPAQMTLATLRTNASMVDSMMRIQRSMERTSAVLTSGISQQGRDQFALGYMSVMQNITTQLMTSQMPPGYAPSGHAPAGYVPAGYLPAGHAPAGFVPVGYAPPGYASATNVAPGFIAPVNITPSVSAAPVIAAPIATASVATAPIAATSAPVAAAPVVAAPVAGNSIISAPATVAPAAMSAPISPVVASVAAASSAPIVPSTSVPAPNPFHSASSSVFASSVPSSTDTLLPSPLHHMDINFSPPSTSTNAIAGPSTLTCDELAMFQQFAGEAEFDNGGQVYDEDEWWLGN